MPLPEGPHLDRLREALAAEAVAHRALLAGDEATGRAAMGEAARRYRASWEAAPPAGYGRLIGMLKAAVIGGDARNAADYATAAIPADAASAPASYARAIAALVLGDDARARAAAQRMLGASPAFERTAQALVALAEGDRE